MSACRLFKLFTIFLLSWPQPSLHSLENKWISHDCTSRGNHTYCKKSVKFMRTNTCRESNLMDFKQWDFMSSSVLLKVLPVDAERRNFVRQVRDAVFSFVRPVPLKYKPSLIAVSSEVLTEILDLKMFGAVSQAFVEFIAGNKILPNSVLLSHRYGGHQVCICIKLDSVFECNFAMKGWRSTSLQNTSSYYLWHKKIVSSRRGCKMRI